MEGMLVVMKSAICCRAKRLVGVLPFFSWSWIDHCFKLLTECLVGISADTFKMTEGKNAK